MYTSTYPFFKMSVFLYSPPNFAFKESKKERRIFLALCGYKRLHYFLDQQTRPHQFQGRPTTLVPDQARPKLVQRLVSSLARTILSKQSKFEEFETFFKVQGFLSLNSVGAEKLLTTPSSVIVRSTNPIWAGK